jgi:hypothetical protein
MATYPFDTLPPFELRATVLPSFSPLKDAFIAYFITRTNMNWNTLTTLFNHEFQTCYPDWTPLYGTLFYRWIWMKRAMNTNPQQVLPSDMSIWVTHYGGLGGIGGLGGGLLPGESGVHQYAQLHGKQALDENRQRKLRDTESWEWMREEYFDRFWKNEGLGSRPYDFLKRMDLTSEERILGDRVRRMGWEIRRYLGVGGFDGAMEEDEDEDDDEDIDIDALLPWGAYKPC